MSAVALQSIAQQIETLGPEEKWTLLEMLVESLRRQVALPRRSLVDYYGAGQGRGLGSADAVDAHIAEERASWER
jgi:hypothetical protein